MNNGYLGNSLKILTAFFAAAFMCFGLMAYSADQGEKKSPSGEVPSTDVPAKPTSAGGSVQVSSTSGLFDSLWTRVRSMVSSGDENMGEEPRYSTTAGIRGAKSIKDILKPIWKGKDRKGDEALTPEQKLYHEANQHIEKEEYDKAITKLEEFLKVYKSSDKRPLAQVSLGLCYQKVGKTDMAVKTLDDFLKTYPDHPLAEDVKKLKAEMEK